MRSTEGAITRVGLFAMTIQRIQAVVESPSQSATRRTPPARVIPQPIEGGCPAAFAAMALCSSTDEPQPESLLGKT